MIGFVRGLCSVLFGVRLPFNVTAKRPPPEGTFEPLAWMVWGPLVVIVLASSAASASYALAYALGGPPPPPHIAVAMLENAWWIVLLWRFLPCLLPGRLQRHDAQVTRAIAQLPVQPSAWSDFDVPRRSSIPSILFFGGLLSSSICSYLYLRMLPMMP